MNEVARLKQEVVMLKKNVRDLQEQLGYAYTRLKEEIEKNETKPDKGLYNPDAGHIEDE